MTRSTVSLATDDPAAATHQLGKLVRTHDPCVSCATHLPELRIVDAGRGEGNG